MLKNLNFVTKALDLLITSHQKFIQKHFSTIAFAQFFLKLFIKKGFNKTEYTKYPIPKKKKKNPDVWQHLHSLPRGLKFKEIGRKSKLIPAQECGLLSNLNSVHRKIHVSQEDPEDMRGREWGNHLQNKKRFL